MRRSQQEAGRNPLKSGRFVEARRHMSERTITFNCFECQSRVRSDWCALKDDDLDLLNRAKKAKNFKVGDILFLEGDECRGIHCVESGSVALRKSDAEGNSVLVHLAHGGETVGYRALLADEPYGVTAEVVAPAKICFIHGPDVRRLIDKNPALGLRFLAHAARDVREAHENYLRAATGSVRARLVHLLFTLRERYAEERDDGGLVLTLPLSRQDLAAMVGTRPETISRTIRKMEDDGVAKFSGRKVHIADPTSLLDEVEPVNYQ
jgi:CRP-like cAMP-binding protein